MMMYDIQRIWCSVCMVLGVVLVCCYGDSTPFYLSSDYDMGIPINNGASTSAIELSSATTTHTPSSNSNNNNADFRFTELHTRGGGSGMDRRRRPPVHMRSISDDVRHRPYVNQGFRRKLNTHRRNSGMRHLSPPSDAASLFHFLETHAKLKATGPLPNDHPSVVGPFGGTLDDGGLQHVTPRVPLAVHKMHQSNGVFESPALTEVMSQIKSITANPQPNMKIADHHKPLFEHFVVPKPDVMPPTAPPPPPSNKHGVWQNPPPLANRAVEKAPKAQSMRFTTRTLADAQRERAKQLQHSVVARPAEPKVGGSGPGANFPRFAPPPPLPSHSKPTKRSPASSTTSTHHVSPKPMGSSGFIPSLVEVSTATHRVIVDKSNNAHHDNSNSNRKPHNIFVPPPVAVVAKHESTKRSFD